MTRRYFGMFLSLVLSFLVVFVSIFFVVKGWRAAKTEEERALKAAQLKADYLERVSWIRSIPEEAKYQVEVKNFLQWYFGQMEAHVGAFHLNPRFDDYLKELESPGNADRQEERRRVYESVRTVFDLMRQGRYSPRWSASSQGVRLDILSTQVILDEKREKKVRYQLVLWGLPRVQTVDDRGLLRIQSRATFRAQWRMFDMKGKRIAEMHLEGNMPGRIDWPERYISMFPSDVTLGHYDVDLMPFNAETVEAQFNISSPSLSGGDMSPVFVWKQSVPPEWRLRPGETWQGALPVAGLSSTQ
ncbi:MAG: hypothetical protein FWD46_01680 [Cystobacterineae bacterium]|nr:hypothetical protein [Cystobacterineae bacterium]